MIKLIQHGNLHDFSVMVEETDSTSAWTTEIGIISSYGHYEFVFYPSRGTCLTQPLMKAIRKEMKRMTRAGAGAY